MIFFTYIVLNIAAYRELISEISGGFYIIISGRGESMKDYIEERTAALAHYIIETGSTVRKTAAVFHVSKSTVHKDITERLRQINPQLADEAAAVLMENKAERHIRGGLATKEKYIKLKKEKNTY